MSQIDTTGEPGRARGNGGPANGLSRAEVADWIDSLDEVIDRLGADSAGHLLHDLQRRASRSGAPPASALTTPYVNTIPRGEQARYPGDLELERRIKSLVRWNAMAMVVRANREHDGLGGHISTYASAATLLEVGFNHFFRNTDLVYFQGHASPGVYARAFLEGRLDAEQLRHFRREVDGKGLSSYPHPWLMPDFWQFPTVSMGLSPILALYQARLLRYLHDRGLADTSDIRVWCLLGDGECDEPETLGALSLASRESLDNLSFVINCNLQRLDGPVRGNGKIIQELETVFRGSGWNVIKVIWGGDWDPLLEKDVDGELVRRMDAAVDGEYQKYSASSGAYIRQHFFGTSEKLRALVEHLSDDELQRLRRGGHDPRKVYAAYDAAVRHRGGPSVILAKTIKGYGLGEAGEGRNVTHQQKKLNEEELRRFRGRFQVPLPDEETRDAVFFRPPEDGPELRYLRERREALGGFIPVRQVRAEPLPAPDAAIFEELRAGSERPVATTMAMVRLLDKLMDDDAIGERIVPIIPDEARTFGMDALFRKHGIYAHAGQRYEPVDRSSLLYYREAQDGQILEEGITEAGSISSFTAAGTAYAHLGLELAPFFLFYSMFGFQRVGDFIWAAADARAKGFLLGGTAGRTTLNGEGLQHQDGHSQLLAATVPTVRAYDPAYAYELAVIVRDGMARMFERGEVWQYYLTMYNEPYPQPAMPATSGGDDDAHEGAGGLDLEEAIVRGMYRIARGEGEGGHVQLLGSGPILREVLRARDLLAEHLDVGADVWSVTSYGELRREALAVERDSRLHPGRQAEPSYVERALAESGSPVVAASDWMKLVAEQIARWVPGRMTVLGTDGFGRSDTRARLRRHFEIDAEHITLAAATALGIDAAERAKLRDALNIDADAPDPVSAAGGTNA